MVVLWLSYCMVFLWFDILIDIHEFSITCQKSRYISLNLLMSQTVSETYKRHLSTSDTPSAARSHCDSWWIWWWKWMWKSKLLNDWILVQWTWPKYDFQSKRTSERSSGWVVTVCHSGTDWCETLWPPRNWGILASTECHNTMPCSRDTFSKQSSSWLLRRKTIQHSARMGSYPLVFSNIAITW